MTVVIAYELSNRQTEEMSWDLSWGTVRENMSGGKRGNVLDEMWG